jgi:hypothetical protein
MLSFVIRGGVNESGTDVEYTEGAVRGRRWECAKREFSAAFDFAEECKGLFGGICASWG